MGDDCLWSEGVPQSRCSAYLKLRGAPASRPERQLRSTSFTITSSQSAESPTPDSPKPTRPLLPLLPLPPLLPLLSRR